MVSLDIESNKTKKGDMHRNEISISRPTTVRLPMHSLYNDRSSCTSASVISEEKGQYQLTKATLDEIIKYRRCLIAIVLCLAYAIVGIFLIVLKGAPVRQMILEETDQLNLAYSDYNTNSIENATTEPEIINSWHVHTSDSLNTTQSLKHKHVTNGTKEFKDCGSIDGKRVKYGNVGCLFRRVSDSDLSGDLCCCPGPIKYKIHHNHTSVKPGTNHSDSLPDTRKLMTPNIICFVTKSARLFNVHKVVPPLARNSKATFRVLKSHSVSSNFPLMF